MFTKPLTANRNFVFEFKNNWKTLGSSYSGFTFVNLEFENDVIMGGYIFEIGLLGFTFYFRYNHTETEEMKNLKRIVDEINEREFKSEEIQKDEE